jgi:hypothetical protein
MAAGGYCAMSGVLSWLPLPEDWGFDCGNSQSRPEIAATLR